MSPNDLHTPGFAILARRRSRDFISAREALSPFADARSGADLPDEAVDLLTGSVLRLEADVDSASRAGTLTAVREEELRGALAEVGAAIIDARFDRETDQGALVLELSRTIATLNAELTEVRRQAAASEADAVFLREQVTTLLVTLGEARDATRLERAAVSALELRVHTLQTQLDDAAPSPELDALRETVRDLDGALRDLRFRLLDQNREIEVVRAEHDLVRAQLSDTEALLRATHTELVRTRSRLATAESQADALRADAGTAAAELTLMETWMNQALSRCAQLEAEVAMLRAGAVIAAA